MKKPEAMMFYPEAWKGSPSVAAMTPAARSGYFELLCAMWLSGGSLPDEDRILQANSRLSPKEWKDAAPFIRAELVPTSDGRLTQRRLLEEYERTVELQARRKKGGKEGARRRWQADRSPIGSPNRSPIGTPNANPMQTETETETITNPTDSRTPKPPRLPPQPTIAFGEFGHVRLTEQRHAELEKALGAELPEYIERFDTWVEEAPNAKTSGVARRDRDPYLTIRNWFRRDQKENQTGKGGVSSAEQRTRAKQQANRAAIRNVAERLGIGGNPEVAGNLRGAVLDIRRDDDGTEGRALPGVPERC